MKTLSKLGRYVRTSLGQHRHKVSYAGARNYVLDRFPRHSIGAEIGVWKGEFSSELLEAVKPIKLHLIDPWKFQSAPEFSQAFYGGAIGQNQQNMDLLYRSVVEKFRKQIADGIVEVNRGASDQVAAQFPDNYFDWIYVDGDHRYDGALKDLEMYHSKLKAGAIVAGDDYADADQWWGDDVIRAVDEAVRRGLYRDLVVKYNQFVLVKA